MKEKTAALVLGLITHQKMFKFVSSANFWNTYEVFIGIKREFEKFDENVERRSI